MVGTSSGNRAGGGSIPVGRGPPAEAQDGHRRARDRHRRTGGLQPAASVRAPTGRSAGVRPAREPSPAAGSRFRPPPPVGLLAVLAGIAVAVPWAELTGWTTLGHVDFYPYVVATALLLAWVSVVRARLRRPWPWRLLVAGFTAWFVGDCSWALEALLLGRERSPAWADAFYLVGYASLLAGVLALVRTRSGARDPAAVLDATIVTVGAAVPTWVFVIAPLGDTHLGPLGTVVTALIPMLNLFLLAVLARLLATRGARTGAYRRLVWALLVVMGADAVFYAGIFLRGADFASVWVDAAWMAGYVLVSAAARHPSMAALTEPPPRQERPPGRRRLVALALASCLPGATLAADGWHDGQVAWEPAAVGCVVLSLLALARMSGLLEQVRVQAVQLSALARVDGLTGVPNRRTWDHELSRACAASRDTGEPLALGIVDLDHFKRFNDERGHQAGDRLLREAASAWADRLEAHGGLLCRYGGEEFAVLLPGRGSDEACAVLDELRWLTPSGQTFSAGVAVWDPRTDPGEAVRAADAALYEAKRAGRDRVVAAGSPVEAGGLPVWAEDVRVLLRPVVSCDDGSLVGHEAAPRFHHHVDGTQLVARAREEGYGDDLEAEILRRALDLPRRPPGSSLFVQVSAAAAASRRFWELAPDDLSGVVVGLAADGRPQAPAEHTAGPIQSDPVQSDPVQSGPEPDGPGPDHPDPGDPDLTVSETAALARQRGAALAVHGLGASGGDLDHVLVVRPDVVTLDSGLAGGCADDPARLRLLEALVALATATGARVCAEGVASADDLAALRRCGVHLVQGEVSPGPCPGTDSP